MANWEKGNKEHKQQEQKHGQQRQEQHKQAGQKHSEIKGKEHKEGSKKGPNDNDNNW